MNRIRNSIPFAFTIIALFGATLSCNFDETENKAIIFSQYYKINSQSLLGSLKVGETDTFSQVDRQPKHVPQEQQLVVNWTEANYLYIAYARHGSPTLLKGRPKVSDPWSIYC